MAKLLLAIAAAACAVTCPAARAHHSGAVFDLDAAAQIKLSGVVVEFKLRSPHATFVLDARVVEQGGVERDGPVERWEVEWESVPLLRTLRVDADTFAPGDPITIAAAPHRDPKFRFAKALAVGDAFGDEYLMANSDRLFSPTIVAAAEALTGEAVDDESRAVPARAGIEGRWQQPLLEFAAGSPNLPLNEAGMKAWRAYVHKSSPANTCEPLGVPDVFTAPFFLFDLRIDGTRAVLHNEAYDVRRVVPLDGSTAAVDERGWFGRASGRVDDGMLVVESSGFPASKWGLGRDEAHGGADIPSSERKTLVERFAALPDGRTLVYEYTLHDPHYMTQPYTARVELTRVPDDAEMYAYECEVESASMWSRDANERPLRVEQPR